MKTENKVTFEQIEALAKKGVLAKNASKQLGIAYHKIQYILEKNNTKYSDLFNDKKPQDKAWETINKNKQIEAYKAATSSGIKASINRKFKAEFGVSINVTIEKPKIEKPKIVKVSKVAFNLKDVALMIPFAVQQMFDKQNKRIEELETIVKNLTK